MPLVASNTPAEFGNLTPTEGNYASLIDFSTSQHLPGTYAQQVKRFGNRMLSGFLSAVAAEEAIQASKVQWTEEGRLHLRYTATKTADGANNAGETFTITGPNSSTHGLRVGNLVILSDSGGDEYKGRVSTVGSAGSVTIKSFTAPTSGQANSVGFDDLSTDPSAVTITVYGTEFNKGSNGISGSNDREYTDRENNLTIQKAGYKINGSDYAQIGWIETFSEAGESNGYFWWHTSELDERERFMDYLESTALEAVPSEASSRVRTDIDDPVGANAGSEGLFYVLENEGNEFTGGFDDSSAENGRDDFDLFVKQLDKQGAIEENMFYLDRDESLAFDNIMALQNGGGIAVGAADNTVYQGTNYGMFNNAADMALNLGFKSVTRGSYTFHKTDWKYLNDYVGRSGHGTSSSKNIQGIMVPGGSKNVYDQSLGRLVNRPYLHIRYRQAGIENRKFKNWVTGSVGARTSDEDAMNIHYLTERCLITQAPNNFAILKRA